VAAAAVVAPPMAPAEVAAAAATVEAETMRTATLAVTNVAAMKPATESTR
jgi:hypothetical protein